MSATWLLAAVVAAVPAQEATGWDAPEAVALVERAIERRASITRDSALVDYRAHATGHVYFLFDLGPATPRHLVKADQVALDLYWQAPGLTRQVIVGRREEKHFPSNIHYHIDHLTVVMDNFGDRIRVGEGDEVQDVLHPAAPGALDFYEYRFADSLTLRLPDGEIRVLGLEVRPRDVSRPGIIGSLYLDRATAAIVRMDFTFTAASYLDPQLQYIHIVLENSLWQRRYWLPWRQGVELRRELEWLDFPAGGVIRAEFRIGGYAFNTGLPDGFFRGARVSQLPEPQRRAYPFERDLYAGLRADELRLGGDLEAIAPQAAELVGRRYLEGLTGRPRLFAAGGSSWLRYRRAEGLYLGPGASADVGSLHLSGTAGYAVHAHRWEGTARAEWRPGATRLWVESYGRRVADAGPRPAAPGAVRTLGALLDGEDYEEPYFASGLEVGASVRWGGGRWGLFTRLEEHEVARLAAPETFGDFRPVRAMREGTVWGGGVFVEFGAPAPAPAGLAPLAGPAWALGAESFGGDFEWTTLRGRARYGWGGSGGRVHLTADAAAGASFGPDLPPQALVPLGGRGTLRGYDFHEFVGNRFAIASLDLAFPVRRPWVTAHAFADAGWSDLAGPAGDALTRWNAVGAPARTTDGVRSSAGVGLGLVYDILRLEAARGLRGGTWEWIVTIHPAFWPWL